MSLFLPLTQPTGCVIRCRSFFGGGGDLPTAAFMCPYKRQSGNVWFGDLAGKLVDHKTNPAIKIIEIACRPKWGGAPSCWNHSLRPTLSTEDRLLANWHCVLWQMKTISPSHRSSMASVPISWFPMITAPYSMEISALLQTSQRCKGW